MTLKGKEGGGSSWYVGIFKSNERNGEEGLKDNVLRQKENLIWPERLKRLLQK